MSFLHWNFTQTCLGTVKNAFHIGQMALCHILACLYAMAKSLLTVLCEMVIALEQQQSQIDVSDASLQCWQKHAAAIKCNAHDKHVVRRLLDSTLP